MVGTVRKHLLYLLIAGAAWPLGAAPAAAEVQAEVAVSRGPHYVGLPAMVRVTVAGFEEQPEPQCELVEPPEGILGKTVAVSPQVYSQIVRRNGRVFQSRSVTHVVQFAITADVAGKFRLGPLVLSQGGIRYETEPIELEFQEVPRDPNMRILLKLPKGPVYPDQRVPVEIQWWYAGEIRDVQSLQIHSELFDKLPFLPDGEPERGQSRMPIETAQGRIGLPATAAQRAYQERQYTVLTARRTLVPQRPGTYVLAPITATVERATEWERRGAFDDFGPGGSLFDQVLGGRRPRKTELSRAVGEPLELEVREFPRAGRPDSFAGAVGRGFSLEVTAGRTVVRVGDPIPLTVRLRGAGNLENASLPSLSADRGLAPEQFRWPDSEITGTLAGNVKTFQVSVRVEDEAVTEIPALAYSWFDPEAGEYRTTHSKPVALRVMPARVVSAKDVVSGRGQRDNDRGEAVSGSAAQGAAPSSDATALRSASDPLGSADLALAIDPQQVLQPGAANGWVLQTLLYLGGILLVAWAVSDRRRRRVPPKLRELERELAGARGRIRAATTLPSAEAARTAARELQALLALVPGGPREETARLIAECEAVAYAPGHVAAPSPSAELLERAQALADRFVPPTP